MMDRYDLGGEIIDEMNEKICWLERRADQLREGDFDELLCVLLDYDSVSAERFDLARIFYIQSIINHNLF